MSYNGIMLLSSSLFSIHWQFGFRTKTWFKGMNLSWNYATRCHATRERLELFLGLSLNILRNMHFHDLTIINKWISLILYQGARYKVPYCKRIWGCHLHRVGPGTRNGFSVYLDNNLTIMKWMNFFEIVPHGFDWGWWL